MAAAEGLEVPTVEESGLAADGPRDYMVNYLGGSVPAFLQAEGADAVLRLGAEGNGELRPSVRMIRVRAALPLITADFAVTCSL